MDPRVRDHAEVIADHSVSIEKGDRVEILAPTVAEDLAVALYEKIGECGAKPSLSMRSPRAKRAFLRSCDADDIDLPDHSLAALEETDVVIIIKGSENTAETSDVPTEKVAAQARAHAPIQQERMGKRWVGTQFPASGDAQLAEMSTEAYEEFVYGAVNKDWDQQRKHQQQMVEILDSADEVRIVSGDTTDLTMSVSGMKTVNDYGEKNLPGGEVFTAPVPDSVEGEVLFDKPLVRQGSIVENVWLEFEDGEVVDFSAEKNEEVLAGVLDTDEGARRLGELGIGMNRDIDRFTYNMLFDEKMGDTIHLAVGKAIEQTVPEGQPLNESATHIDMIVDMSEDSFIEVDGEIVQRNGTFRFEDGFEG
ncbi:peptidase M29 aminopeptidase II [Haladaptatus paucihalophilus DX253]|uniref:Peptidase M29 aminopeptidase II n=2 Tax=Haladaptatus paucihalophilus DX253 TaxID=797209 RepID=E7QY90_HALPU|nr:aminopeptidase [Haladaptatus paucihalophilus]EFW90556.1 peptidase M29 aminopeptidase II [Haladaptatus paucihalophilus DX253]